MEQEKNKNEERKQMVINWLKQLERVPTSRFVGLMALDYDFMKEFLDLMANEGLIIKEVETKAIYWRLPKKSDNLKVKEKK